MADPDVIVIGGGPGGSTAATMLARKGWSVRLLERERFPRDHIGESLLPASLPVLDMLGVLPEVERAGFLPKYGATMVWGKDTTPWSWYFRETNKRHTHAYQVWRPTFDHLLLKNAAANGVEVLEEHRVLEVLFDGDRTTGVRYSDAEGVEHRVSARFVVDASGQTGIIGRLRHLRQPDASFQNLAVYAYYEGAERLPEPDATNILVESYEHGWFWNIPLHTGLMSVGAVVDHTVGQEGIRTLGPEAYLRSQIAMAYRTNQMLANARLVSGPHILRDWSYLSQEVAGDGWVLAGDAACFIDPLFSSGVHLALSAGVMAAAYVTSAIRTPEMREPAGKVYQELYYQQYGHFREMAKLFYSSNLSTDSYFWEARRLLADEPGLTPRESFIRAVAGQPPQGYERVVLERGHAPRSFVDDVRSMESARATRTQEAHRVLTDPATIGTAILVPAPDMRVERKPVLGDGEFEWGVVVTTSARPEGVPLSAAAAKLLTLIDGSRTAAGVIAALIEGLPPERADGLAQAAASVLQVLYVDGVIERFEVPDAVVS